MRNLLQGLADLRRFRPTDLALALIVGSLYAMGPIDNPMPGLSRNTYFLMGVLYVVPIAFQHVTPSMSAIVLIGTSTCRYWFTDTGAMFVDISVLSVLYVVTAYGPKLVHTFAFAITLVNCIAWNVPTRIQGDRIVIEPENLRSLTLNAVLYMTLVVLSYCLGYQHHRQLCLIGELKKTAGDAQDRLATEAEVAMLEERSRIARDMHDIVAHTLSVVIAQADGGRYAAAKNPQMAVRALSTIADMSRDALKDIRSIIGVLRDSDSEAQPRLPQPVDSDLEELVANVRESGVRISLVRTGAERPLPVGVSDAVYRICQEAITNSLKHAGPGAEITVILNLTNTALQLRVDDDGRGAATVPDGRGHGLIGMDERARAFGGTVTTGPRSRGGFRVSVTIPVPPLHDDSSDERKLP